MKHMAFMFGDVKNLKSVIFYPYINTNIIISMSYMFWECTSLTSINLTNFDTKSVTSMELMFFL